MPSHVREPYLYHLLCNPPETIVHLRRAPPEPIKHGRHKSRQPSKPKSNVSTKKKLSGQDDVPEQPPPTIIFCRRPYTAAYLTHVLQELSIRATALHSRLTQRERLNSLSLFRAYVVPVLVCTDVGARGLDIEDVAMVINWDMPEEPEEYTHRVGRTARQGKGGVAVSFVTERDEERMTKVEARIRVSLNPRSVSQRLFLMILSRHQVDRDDTIGGEGARKVERRIHGEEAGEYGEFIILISNTVTCPDALSGAP